MVIFKNTGLLTLTRSQDVFYATATDLHRKSLDKLRAAISLKSGDLRLSRTNHGQLAALVIRYDASPEAVAACQEALLLERIAAELVQEVAEERGRGNVHFVRVKGGKVL